VIGEFRAVNEVNPTGVNKTCIIGEGGILESALEVGGQVSLDICLLKYC